MTRVYLLVAKGEQVIPPHAYASRRMAELALWAKPIPAAYDVVPLEVRGAKLRRGVIFHGTPRPAPLRHSDTDRLPSS